MCFCFLYFCRSNFLGALSFLFFLPPSSSCLSLSPSLQGRCVITVQLTDDELAADEEGVDYFLLFVGSTQRHLTSTLRSSHDTLQALCPGKPLHPQRLAASFPTSNEPLTRRLHPQHLIHVESIFNSAVMSACVN